MKLLNCYFFKEAKVSVNRLRKKLKIITKNSEKGCFSITEEYN
jgi:hypothetical protein